MGISKGFNFCVLIVTVSYLECSHASLCEYLLAVCGIRHVSNHKFIFIQMLKCHFDNEHQIKKNITCLFVNIYIELVIWYKANQNKTRQHYLQHKQYQSSVLTAKYCKYYNQAQPAVIGSYCKVLNLLVFKLLI